MPRHRSTYRVAAHVSIGALVLALAACSPGGGRAEVSAAPSGTTAAPGESASPTPVATPAPSTNPTTTGSPPPDALAGWTLEQKVGQLFMVGVDVHDPGEVAYRAVRDLHVGNVFLAGRTQVGAVRVKKLVDWLKALVSPATTHSTPLLVATDQEGGAVQTLRGPGFSDLPSALDQSGLAPAALRTRASTWGAELAGVGINLDLAPVMDLVPSAADAEANPPVGALGRNYGYTVDDITRHANAFAAGLESAGVAVAIKHFPGLGQVTANTDLTAGVTDALTTRDGPSIAAFRSGVDAGAAFVMTSTAVYAQIDPTEPAAFSPVVTDLLRGTLGFRGVVMTDDVSAAEQVLAWSPADRAIDTIEAGGDLVLVSKSPGVISEMVEAVVARARTDPAFAAKVDAAAVRVLAAKEPLPR